MTTKPIDNFILNSVSLFNVNPSQSAISITYQPPKILNNSDASRISEGKKVSKSKKFGKVTFKTSNPHLSANYKFITNKNKDVSRLLNAIGSNGVSIKPLHILKRRINQKRHKSLSLKNKKKKISNYSITGLATLLTNDTIPKYDPSINNNNNNNNKNTLTNNNNDSTVSKNKNKNKNKSKNKNKKKR